MNIAGALLEGVLEQPVDDIDDVGVVGIRLAIGGTEIDQLLEVADATALLLDRRSAGDRAGQAKEFLGVAGDVRGAGHHALDRPLQHMGEVALPAVHEGLGAGHRHLVRAHRHGQDLVALGEGIGHQRGDRGHVHLERIDAVERLLRIVGQPAGQAVQIQLAPRTAEVVHALRRQELQRMLLRIGRAAAQEQALFGGLLVDPPLADQLTQDIAQVEPTISGRGGYGGHLDSLKRWSPRMMPGL